MVSTTLGRVPISNLWLIAVPTLLSLRSVHYAANGQSAEHATGLAWIEKETVSARASLAWAIK